MFKKLALSALGAVLMAAAPGALAQSAVGYADADLPPDPKVGECYARVYVPAQFVSETEQVLSKSAAERLEVIPAAYDTVTEQIMVKPATTRLVEVPAVYGTEEETIQTAAARTEWKRGPCDPKRQIANATGECLCLVEIPAQYKTVRRTVMTQPPTTREVVVPAEYKTITRTVEVRAAAERRIPIAAEYQTVSRQVKVSDPLMKWQIIDCKYGSPVLDSATTLQLQRILADKGYDPGPIDGIFGPLTRNALQNFQEANNLPHEGLGSNTRTALGMPSVN